MRQIALLQQHAHEGNNGRASDRHLDGDVIFYLDDHLGRRCRRWCDPSGSAVAVHATIGAIPFHGSVQFAANIWALLAVSEAHELADHHPLFGLDAVRDCLWCVVVPGPAGRGRTDHHRHFYLLDHGGPVVPTIRTEMLPLWTFIPVGFIAGAMNIVVGIFRAGGGRAARAARPAKETVVGTMSVFGFLSNFLKVAGFTYVGSASSTMARRC